MKKLLTWTWLVISILLLPISLLVVVAIFNPFYLVFIIPITITNESTETIYVTPVGTVGKQNHKTLLPLSYFEFPYVPRISSAHFRLKPGSSMTFYYDFDDVQFSEIAIRNTKGSYRQFVVDPNPTEGQYSAPMTRSFAIGSFALLPEIDRGVLEVVQNARMCPITLVLFTIFISPIINLMVSIKIFINVRRKRKKYSYPNPA